MTTVLTEAGAVSIAGAQSDGDSLWIPRGEVTRATGWALKPEGMCRGEVCVPVPKGREREFLREDAVDVAALWRHMGHPVLHDASGETWMLGTGAGERANALQTLDAPDFTLPDLDGRLHSLSDYRGKRVFLMTWSSW